MTKIRV